MYPAYQILGLQKLLRGLQGRSLPVIAGGGFFRVLDPRELAFPKEIRALEIARGLLPFRPRIRWFALGSVADIVRLRDKDLRLLQQSGCHRIEMGSESGSDPQLGRLGKRHRAGDILEATARLRAHGIHSTHNLIFGSLGEEPSDRRATFRLARKIGRIDPKAHLQFRLYQVVPGTSHGDQALRSMPWFPKSLDQLATFRLGLAQGQRSLPWLSEEEEDLLHKLTDYVLPLAFHHPHPSKHPLVQTFFRRLARARVRTGLQLGLRWEERIYRKAIGEPLLTTYLP
ncbi:MAG TPA: radical SAM protein [Planctomycetes bacterium]|nr:radical SAM protein [Planctomycetota bacterium]